MTQPRTIILTTISSILVATVTTHVHARGFDAADVAAHAGGVIFEQFDQSTAQGLAGLDIARHDDELADIAGRQLLIQPQVVAWRTGADVGDMVRMLVEFCTVAVEPSSCWIETSTAWPGVSVART